jgi:D-proline reductase (dithiol) PrdB
MSQNLPPSEELTLKEFATTLYHNIRANNYFKFLKDFPPEKLDVFFQQLLREVGNTIDSGDITELARLVQQTQVEGYRPSAEVARKRSQSAPQPVTLVPLTKPLSKSTIALFTTAAVRKKDQVGWYPPEQTYMEALKEVRSAFERFPSWRFIERDTSTSELEVGHIAFDITAAQRDLNVIFPIERFRELEVEGYIGQLAEVNYSIQGLTNLQRLEQEAAPGWAKEIKARGVDAVFLTPG